MNLLLEMPSELPSEDVSNPALSNLRLNRKMKKWKRMKHRRLIMLIFCMTIKIQTNPHLMVLTQKEKEVTRSSECQP